jgi:predicted acyltransferase
MNYPITIKAGDTTQVNFGAQKQAAFENSAAATQQQTKKSPLLAIIGIVLILIGVGIVVVFGILKRRD